MSITTERLPVPAEADAVFEGGGVKGIAFAGAITAAEEAGVREWKNVAGTSAGAIAASLLVAGFHGRELEKRLAIPYRPFADYGFGGFPRGLLNALAMRGLARGRYFERWLRGQLAESPRARELGKEELTFGDLARPRSDFADDVPEAQVEKARYRLRVIASDVTAGRMLVLPQGIRGFSLEKDGPPVEPDALPVVTAVRMSMSFPFLYTPVVLWEGSTPHYIVDGGLLSNFPVWLFDSQGRPPKRPTWGFRLHGGQTRTPSRIGRRIDAPPLWPLGLTRAMFLAATEAWDHEHAETSQSVRTTDIPTGKIGTTDFGLTSEDAESLRDSGRQAAAAYFAGEEVQEYLRTFEARVAGAAV